MSRISQYPMQLEGHEEPKLPPPDPPPQDPHPIDPVPDPPGPDVIDPFDPQPMETPVTPAWAGNRLHSPVWIAGLVGRAFALDPQTGSLRRTSVRL